MIEGGDAHPGADLRDALRDAATQAREQGVRAEELVVALKALIEDVCRAIDGPGAVPEQPLHDRIVSACIKAYFGSEAEPHAQAPRRRLLIQGIFWTVAERPGTGEAPTSKGAAADDCVLEFTAVGRPPRYLDGAPGDWASYSDPALMAFWIEAGNRSPGS